MKKILIACTLMLAVGSIATSPSFAQKSTDISTTAKVTNESFIKLVKQYEKSENKQVEQKSMEQLVNSMRSSITQSKVAFETPANKTELNIKKYDNQVALYDKFMNVTKDEHSTKEQIMHILKEFSSTL